MKYTYHAEMGTLSAAVVWYDFSSETVRLCMQNRGPAGTLFCPINGRPFVGPLLVVGLWFGGSVFPFRGRSAFLAEGFRFWWSVLSLGSSSLLFLTPLCARTRESLALSSAEMRCQTIGLVCTVLLMVGTCVTVTMLLTHCSRSFSDLRQHKSLLACSRCMHI
jgi:hypothetical protein